MSSTSASARTIFFSASRCLRSQSSHNLTASSSSSCTQRLANSTPRTRPLSTVTHSTCIYTRLRPVQASIHPSRFRRRFSSTPIPQHGHIDPPKPGEERKVTFIDKDSTETTFLVSDGDNLLDIAQHHDIEMEGACGGSCACSTCHIIVEGDEFYDKMPEPDDDENDMLDLAFGLTETSRLGCQVVMTKELDGLRVRMPAMTRNLQASDFEEKKK